jgi:hypothetical protein
MMNGIAHENWWLWQEKRISFPTIIPTAKRFVENLHVGLGWVG